MLNLFIDWAQYIEKPLSCDDIKKKITKLKVCYIVVGIISCLIFVIGLVVLLVSPSLAGKLLGLASLLCGSLSALGTDIWAHLQLAKYKILWEMNNRFETNIEHELRRSEAQDL